MRRKRPASPAPLAPSRLAEFRTHESARQRITRLSKPSVAMPEWPVPKPLPGIAGETGMDDADGGMPIKPGYGYNYGNSIPEAVLGWYASQGFIGYQMMALLSQNWLIEKACGMPARDAIRNGYDLTANDGVKVDPKVLTYIKRLSEQRFKINQNLIDYIRFGRIFGIRVVLFVTAPLDDVEYYARPFNIDGVAPGAYKGVSQIDPYWITPELTTTAVVNPADIRFYEPEFWRVSGLLIHHSHLSIFTTGTVPDVLKPQYNYGGVSVTQRIFERVYAAERTANEAPLLAMTKRMTVLSTDLAEALANQEKFDERMQFWRDFADNFQVKLNGEGDTIQQFDISLNDLDSVIMTQYQLTAAISEVPGTKLLGTQPKGFNSTGEFEESSYHEFLSSLQNNDVSPMLERHYELMIASYAVPKFKIQMFTVSIAWNELDAMTEEERATVNATNAATDQVLTNVGAIEAQDARNRIIADKNSGYNGLSAQLPPMPDVPDNPNDPNADDGDKPAPSATSPKTIPDPKGA